MTLFASGAKISHRGLLWPVLVVGKPLGLNDLRERGALLERVSHDHVTIALAVAEDPRSQSSTAQLDGNLDYKRVKPAKLMPYDKDWKRGSGLRGQNPGMVQVPRPVPVSWRVS